MTHHIDNSMMNLLCVFVVLFDLLLGGVVSEAWGHMHTYCFFSNTAKQHGKIF